MGYIDAGKSEGATCELGGGRYGDSGYFIQPTVFSNTRPDMKIVKEEIFGPVVVLIKFSSDEEVIKMANDTEFGLASAVFSRDISRALTTANKIHAGTVWINCKPPSAPHKDPLLIIHDVGYNQLHNNVPFGGFKQSGIGRELGEYALANYTEVKSIHVNLTGPAPI
jgi:aldehyde dehydrogenase (NAD+)